MYSKQALLFLCLSWDMCYVFYHSSELSVEAKLEESKALCSVLSNHVPDIFVKLGKDGVLYASKRQGGVHFLHYPPASPHLLPVSVVNVTGCGDR